MPSSDPSSVQVAEACYLDKAIQHKDLDAVFASK